MSIQIEECDTEIIIDDLISLFSQSYCFEGTDSQMEGKPIANLTRERLLKRLVTDNLEKAWVAKDGKKIVGYANVIKSEEGPHIFEFHQLNVDLSYRGMGIGKRLMDVRLAHLEKVKEDFDYAATHNVTFHTLSQRLHSSSVATFLNPRVCDWHHVAMSDLGSPFSFIFVVDDIHGKIAKSRQNVHIPERHRQTLEDIYGNLGTERTFRDERKEIPESYIEERKFSIRQLMRTNGYTNLLGFSLDNPTTPSKIDFYESEGFFLCGIVPQTYSHGGSRVVDRAVLAPAASEINPDLIKVLTKYQTLKDAVLGNYAKARKIISNS
ncbi:MAG: GNAT family N-acetyltransferase [Candidatus Woesearchaeota archaeon]